MKRIALLTVLLLVVGLTAGFAIDVKPTVSVTGNATVTLGFDLGTSDVGFSNAADASFTLNLLPADGTDTHAGTGDVFGSITISNIEFYWTDSNAAVFGPADADISAKLVAGPIWIGVYSAPDFAIDKVAAIENDDGTDDDAIVDDETTLDVANDYAGNGTSVNGTFGPVTAGLRVLSATDWNTPAGGPADNLFGFEVYADVKVDPVTFGLVALYDDASNIGFGASAGLTAGPVALTVGFDGRSAAAFDFEVGAGLTFTIVKDTTLAANLVFGDAFDGVVDTTSDIDLKVVFTEPAAAGLVDGLDASLTVYALDFTAGMEYEAILAGGYKVALNDAQSVRPFFSFTYGDPSEVGADSLMKVTAGLEMNLFPLTTLTLQYASGNMSAATPDNGDVTFATKVTY